ncbi:MAG TPA: hypothetical protein VGJ16_00360 [Pirellulales bacterium]
MTRDHAHNPDPNANAARIVRESAGSPEAPPADLEAAWAAWSSHILTAAVSALCVRPI